MKRFVAQKVITAHRAVLGEGPLWEHARGILHSVDIAQAQVLSTNPVSGETVVRQMSGPVSALALSAQGLMAAMGQGLYRVEGEGLLSHLPDGVFGRLNDGKTDPAGRFWVGTGDPDLKPRGHLYRWDASGPQEILGEITMSNGIGWSPDGRRMYYVDTLTKRLDVLDFDPVQSIATGRRTLYEVSEGLPDGLTVDAEGGIWLALWGGGAVLWISPEGELLGRIDVPTPCPTCCTFGGPDLDRLYITTARDESIAGWQDDPLVGAIFEVEVGVCGQAPTPCLL